jgi:Tfp pilus assembly protein PilV
MRMSDCKGFVLADVLVAVVILAIGIASISSLAVNSAQLIRSSTKALNASLIVDEYINSQIYGDLAKSVYDKSTGTSFNEALIILCDSTGSINYKKIVIEFRWDDDGSIKSTRRSIVKYDKP